jgi:hypothetical protein
MIKANGVVDGSLIVSDTTPKATIFNGIFGWKEKVRREKDSSTN